MDNPGARDNAFCELNIVASTHSDIMIQHINNMCQLCGSYNENMEIEKIGLQKEDMMDIDKVAVYQFTDHGYKTSVERILPKDNEFRIYSFTYALKKILEQTVEISDMIDSEGE